MSRTSYTLIVLVALAGYSAPVSSDSTSQATAPQARVTFLRPGSVGPLKIVNATLEPSLAVTVEDLADKIDPAMRPQSPADMRNVVLQLVVVSNVLETMHRLECAALALTYVGAAGGSSPCVGLSFGDEWIFAEKGNPNILLVFHKAGEKRDQKLLFLVPKRLRNVTLELTVDTQRRVQLARIVLP